MNAKPISGLIHRLCAALEGKANDLIDEARRMSNISSILDEALVEMDLAIAKHGAKHLPSISQTLIDYPGGVVPDRMTGEYEMPTESRAKMLTDNARRANELSWSHIMVEELAEVIASKDDQSRRKELLQMMGTIIIWIQDIDNHSPTDHK